jgi:hypothetical protein
MHIWDLLNISKQTNHLYHVRSSNLENRYCVDAENFLSKCLHPDTVKYLTENVQMTTMSPSRFKMEQGRASGQLVARIYDLLFLGH